MAKTGTEPVEIVKDRFINDRSNPFEITCIRPNDCDAVVKKGWKAGHVTRLQEMRDHLADNQLRLYRNDIAMFNVYVSDDMVRQDCVYVTNKGRIAGMGLVHLNGYEKMRCKDIARQLLAAAAELPEMKMLLSNDDYFPDDQKMEID